MPAHAPACGCFITTETQKGHHYLRCTKRVQKNCSQPYVREERVTEQVLRYVNRVRVPTDWINWMEQELETERDRDTQSRQECARVIHSQIGEVAAKIDRLMQAYLDQALSLDEFRQAKAKLAEQKQDLKEKLTAEL